MMILFPYVLAGIGLGVLAILLAAVLIVSVLALWKPGVSAALTNMPNSSS